MEDKSDVSNTSITVTEEELENISSTVSIQTTTTTISNCQKLKNRRFCKRMSTADDLFWVAFRLVFTVTFLENNDF